MHKHVKICLEVLGVWLCKVSPVYTQHYIDMLQVVVVHKVTFHCHCELTCSSCTGGITVTTFQFVYFCMQAGVGVGLETRLPPPAIQPQWGGAELPGGSSHP